MSDINQATQQKPTAAASSPELPLTTEMLTQQAKPEENTSDVNISSKGPMMAGLFMFLALFVGGGGWLYFANLSGAVIATGTVAVQGM